jgi:hypothetical protein
MVLEYSDLSLFKKIYEWQLSQNGEPKELAELEALAQIQNKEDIRKNYSPEWASDKIIKWLNIDPKLFGKDLRDYFWISRDQLDKSISGSSLIPRHIRDLCKNLIGHGSGKILVNTISGVELSKLNEHDLEILLSLLEKELLKGIENDKIHKVFIELMSQKITNSVESYRRVILQVDHDKIPFSLQNDFKLALKNNSEISSILEMFNKKSQIYKALNPKTKA